MPLSARLEKLWAERGDFSRFRPSELTQDTTSNDKKPKGDEQDSVPAQNFSNTQNDFGANLEGTTAIDASSAGPVASPTAGEGKQSDDNTILHARTDVMSIEDMRQLRTQMLEKLGVAQTSLYFAHALVSLLVNSTKASVGPGERASGSGAGTRYDSPALGANRAAAQTSSTSAMHRSGGGQQSQTLGSAGSLEAELGIEQQVFGASRIETMQRDMERPQEDNNEDEPTEAANEEEEEAEAMESLEKDLRQQVRSDDRLLDDEVEERAREVVDCYEGKRDGIRSAINILQHGALTLQPDQSSAKRDRIRWQGLTQAKQAGWGLTPGKAIRGTAGKRRELLDEGMYRRKEDPSRDAWVGFAIPEAGLAYRRRALAYFSHAAPTEGKNANALLFASRSHKKLQVEFTSQNETWVSDADEDNNKAHRDDSIDHRLQQAQSELADAELFESLTAEIRALSSTNGFAKANIVDSDTLSLDVTETLKMRIKMVPSSTPDKHGEAKEEMPKGRDTNSASADAQSSSSSIPTLILALLRLGLVHRYRVSAGLASGARKRAGQHDTAAPLLQPVLGLLHFATFVAALRTVLGRLAKDVEGLRVEMPSYVQVRESQAWLNAMLVDGRHTLSQSKPSQPTGRSSAPPLDDDDDEDSTLKALCGRATLHLHSATLAHITYSFPSRMALTLFMHSGGVSRASVEEEGGESSLQNRTAPSEPQTTSAPRAVHLSSLDLGALDRTLRDTLSIQHGG